jgi:hypothetical protein
MCTEEQEYTRKPVFAPNGFHPNDVDRYNWYTSRTVIGMLLSNWETLEHPGWK